MHGICMGALLFENEQIKCGHLSKLHHPWMSVIYNARRDTLIWVCQIRHHASLRNPCILNSCRSSLWTLATGEILPPMHLSYMLLLGPLSYLNTTFSKIPLMDLRQINCFFVQKQLLKTLCLGCLLPQGNGLQNHIFAVMHKFDHARQLQGMALSSRCVSILVRGDIAKCDRGL